MAPPPAPRFPSPGTRKRRGGSWFHERRPVDFAVEFARGTFPHALASDGLVARVDTYLQDPVLPRPLRRVLLEERDMLVRTLRARFRDAR